jgi:DNA-binding NtrC family response regulator
MSVLQDKKSGGAMGTACRRVLIGEGNIARRDWLAGELCGWGYAPVVVEDFQDLIEELEANDNAMVLLDSDFEADGPLSCYGKLLLDGFSPRLIFLTDQNVPQLSARGERMGVHAFIERSPDLHALKTALNVANGHPHSLPCCGTPLLGISPAIKELRELIRNVAATDAPVMIIGESGTGKELVARALHDCSHRSSEEFVPVNMAALPENLVESVLFGHEKGAFTGADKAQSGLCAHAHRGTLFLDEIGEMNRDLQPKLLRFLQQGTVQRVGSTHISDVDVRVISATNREVGELFEKGAMREDLFFRLHVIPIHVPALRERKEDIPLLANQFLKCKSRQKRRDLSFSSDVMNCLTEYHWPGNIRQLQNMVERLALTAKGRVIGMDAVPAECFSIIGRKHSDRNAETPLTFDSRPHVLFNDRKLTRMQSFERNVIIDALNRHDGKIPEAAKFLGLGQATIYRKIRTLQIPYKD